MPQLLTSSLVESGHLCRSKARTVPSREALTMTKPLEVKVTLVTLLVCSVKVTKHRPLLVFHTFTYSVACVFTVLPFYCHLAFLHHQMLLM